MIGSVMPLGALDPGSQVRTNGSCLPYQLRPLRFAAQEIRIDPGVAIEVERNGPVHGGQRQ